MGALTSIRSTRFRSAGSHVSVDKPGATPADAIATDTQVEFVNGLEID